VGADVMMKGLPTTTFTGFRSSLTVGAPDAATAGVDNGVLHALYTSMYDLSVKHTRARTMLRSGHDAHAERSLYRSS
jgi:hypothetical protein